MGAVLFDPQELEARVAGDRELACDVLETFLQETDRALARLVDAVGQAQAPAVRAAAHYIKGMAGNVAAGQLCETCRELEAAALAGDLTSAPALTARVRTLMGETTSAMRRYLDA